MPERLTHHFSSYMKYWFLLTPCWWRFFFYFFRAQMTALLRSGEQTTDACWRHCAATLLRSPIWPSATRTPWLLPGPVTRRSECGAYRRAPRWLSWRDTRPLSPRCRYEDVWYFLCFNVFVCILQKEDLKVRVMVYCWNFIQTVQLKLQLLLN